MDATHILVIVLVVVGILGPVIGFWAIARMLKKDEAIDAAIYLAQRQLQEYLKEQKK